MTRVKLSLSDAAFASGASVSPTPTTMSFDLHPLYASILENGAIIREGEVLGLDGDLRRVLVAPFDAVIRLLVTGTGTERRVKVYLTKASASRARSATSGYAAGSRPL